MPMMQGRIPRVNAIVLVGIATRLQNKHFIEFGGVTLIDYVVRNLKSFKIFDNIYISTIREIKIDGAITVMDNFKVGPLGGIYSAMQVAESPCFVFGGDMPFIKKESVELMLAEFNEKSIIPRWKNGYIEPLHSLYNFKKFPDIELSSSLHEFVSKIDRTYIPAERFDPVSFFNINTYADLILANQMKRTLK